MIEIYGIVAENGLSDYVAFDKHGNALMTQDPGNTLHLVSFAIVWLKM